MLQKIDSLTERRWRYALILPILFFGLHMYAFNTYYIVETPLGHQAYTLDTIPYQIDTITIFDYNTYEKSVKYEKFVMDTVTTFDMDTKAETVTYERRIIEEGSIADDISDESDIVREKCFIFFWNGLNLYPERQWTVELVRKALDGVVDIASYYTEKCEKVKSWSLKVIVVPEGKDVQVQFLSLDNNKVSKKLFNDGYLTPGTKIFFEDVTVNGKEEKSLSNVITIINDDIDSTSQIEYLDNSEKESKIAKRNPKKLKKIRRTILKENKEELLDILGLKSFNGKKIDLEICVTKSGEVEYIELLKSTTVSISSGKEKAVLKSLYTNLKFEKGTKDEDCGIYIVE